MRNILVSCILLSAVLFAEDAGLYFFGKPEADFAVYLNTATLEKKLEPQLYAQMMAAAKKARRASKSEAELPFTIMDRDWEVVANVHLLPGEFTFLADGVAKTTGGFQKEIESLARLFEEKISVTEYELEGVAARRFVLSENTVKASAQEEDEEETAVETDKLRSLDLMLTPLQGERFQFNGGCNTPLPLDTLELAKPGEENLFVHEDLLLAVYFNIPRLLPLLSNGADNTRVALLRTFLMQLSHMVVSFQPDGVDLVLRVRLAFSAEEQAQAMRGPMAQNVKAMMQGMNGFCSFRDVACVTQGRCCDIFACVNILEAVQGLQGLMRQK
ncbi:MAG: hypothetical protein IJT83_01940 [Victivallales bacterium]|nr:hypothetical protein [Victivallales bacterium]